MWWFSVASDRMDSLHDTEIWVHVYFSFRYSRLRKNCTIADMTQTCDSNALPVALDLLDLQIAEVRTYVRNDCPLLQPMEGKVANMGSFNIMMTSSNENMSALLALCEGNRSIPSQRPVTRSVDVFIDLCLNKWLRQSKRRWFETPSRSLWRHCNVNG